MQNTSYLLTVCQHIHQMGKTPSIALIRQYANRPLVIPEIVKALQLWKAQPTMQAASLGTSEAPESEEPTLEQRVSELEKQVAELKALLKNLQK